MKITLDIPDYSPDRGLQYTPGRWFHHPRFGCGWRSVDEANEAEAELWFNVLEG
ncbi:MAG: hypothetical protein IPH05_14320 [Flavobacteriales bacterium]|nr:hypothetical protein [Flavobacteriales bacterium]